MFHCSLLFKRIYLQLFVTFSYVSLIISHEQNNHSVSIIDKTYCPFIETLSFGSDIHIRCNRTFLTFIEKNNKKSNWRFLNFTSNCLRNGIQQAHLDQCGVRKLNSNYLKVPVKSLEHNENACIYCRVNYKPIAPILTVTQSDGARHILYKFNFTATGLTKNESFEILWAKRVSARFRFSYNYWFLQGCVESIVKIVENTAHTILFAVDDVAISRVEFLIRRCDGICRKYEKCLVSEISKEVSQNYFHVPDSIEKISCDTDCLHGHNSISLTSTRTNKARATFPSTSLSNILYRRTTKIVLVITSGLLLLLVIIFLIFYSLYKIKDKQHVYGKSSQIDPDEHK